MSADHTVKIGFPELLGQMDFISWVIISLLCIMFCASVTIFLFKYMSLHVKIKHARKALSLVQKSTTINDLLDKVSLLQGNFVGSLIARYLTEFKMCLNAYKSQHIPVSEDDWKCIQSHIYQELEHEIAQEESYNMLLATTASISPLFGLFGTVWGLITSFLTVGEQASSSLSSVSTGIAQALLTTVAGLVVAIPALVAFNYVSARMKTLESYLIKITEKCNMIMKIALSSSAYESSYAPAKQHKEREHEL
jgi:biopolymer transport protein TolQ